MSELPAPAAWLLPNGGLVAPNTISGAVPVHAVALVRRDELLQSQEQVERLRAQLPAGWFHTMDPEWASANHDFPADPVTGVKWTADDGSLWHFDTRWELHGYAPKGRDVVAERDTARAALARLTEFQDKVMSALHAIPLDVQKRFVHDLQNADLDWGKLLTHLADDRDYWSNECEKSRRRENELSMLHDADMAAAEMRIRRTTLDGETPDATNPAHLRFAASVAWDMPDDGTRYSKDLTLCERAAQIMRARADALDTAAEAQAAAELLAADIRGELHGHHPNDLKLAHRLVAAGWRKDAAS